MLIDLALKDSLNERFIIISQACIPVYNFNEIYKELFSSNLSRIFFIDYIDPYSVMIFIQMPITIERKYLTKHY